MTLYPTLPSARRRTVARDLVVLLLVLLFAWLGVQVHDGVVQLASLGRGLQDAGTAVGARSRDAAGAGGGGVRPGGGAAGAVREGLGAAADAIDATPSVGGGLAGALRDAGGAAAAPLEEQGGAQARRLVAAGRDGEARAYRAANLLGWLSFLLPTLL